MKERKVDLPEFVREALANDAEGDFVTLDALGTLSLLLPAADIAMPNRPPLAPRLPPPCGCHPGVAASAGVVGA